MEENIYCVYMHILLNDKRKYIGLTKHGSNPNRRWKNGRAYSNQSYFFRAINKYGWSAFRHEILFKNLTKEQAINKEQALIKLFQTQNPKYGFNVTSGGEHCKLPDYRKKYISYDDLYYQYITLNKTRKECAEHFGVSKCAIIKKLHKYNIKK